MGKRLTANVFPMTCKRPEGQSSINRFSRMQFGVSISLPCATIPWCKAAGWGLLAQFLDIRPGTASEHIVEETWDKLNSTVGWVHTFRLHMLSIELLDTVVNKVTLQDCWQTTNINGLQYFQFPTVIFQLNVTSLLQPKVQGIPSQILNNISDDVWPGTCVEMSSGEVVPNKWSVKRAPVFV